MKLKMDRSFVCVMNSGVSKFPLCMYVALNFQFYQRLSMVYLNDVIFLITKCFLFLRNVKAL